MTIAAVLDHRLAEAQRLGLRVKALKVPRDLIARRYWTCAPYGLCGVWTDGVPVYCVPTGSARVSDYAPTL